MRALNDGPRRKPRSIGELHFQHIRNICEIHKLHWYIICHQVTLVHICVYIRMYMYKYIYIYIYVYMYMYMYINVFSQPTAR